MTRSYERSRPDGSTNPGSAMTSPASSLRGPQAVEQQVEFAYGKCPQVTLLAVQREVAQVSSVLLHVLGRVDEHSA